jgi:hypothetical protein
MAWLGIILYAPLTPMLLLGHISQLISIVAYSKPLHSLNNTVSLDAALVRTDVSEKRSASVIRVARIGELRISWIIVPILITLIVETLRSS